METATKINNWTNNNVVFHTDQEIWGVTDYWQTPRETLDHLTGDCEDYAVFKFFTLIAWGVPIDHLQLWYGRSNQGAHMVVNYCGVILDSLTNDILPLEHSSFNPAFRIDNTSLKPWINLTNRIK